MATWFLAPLARLSARHDIDFDLHRDDQNFTARLLESGTVMAAVTSEGERRLRVLGVASRRARIPGYGRAAFAARWFPEGSDRERPVCGAVRRLRSQGTPCNTNGSGAMSVAQEGVPRHYVPASHDYALAVTLGLGWGMVPLLQESSGLVPLGGPTLRVQLFWQQWNLRSEPARHHRRGDRRRGATGSRRRPGPSIAIGHGGRGVDSARDERISCAKSPCSADEATRGLRKRANAQMRGR